GLFQDLARIGLVLGSPFVVGVAVLIAAGLLGVRREVGTAVALIVTSAVALTTTILVRASEDRAPPPGALEAVHGSTFPSVVAAGAVVWVVIAIALAPVVRRIPGRIGLTGLAILFGVALCFAPLVLRIAYLSDV